MNEDAGIVVGLLLFMALMSIWVRLTFKSCMKAWCEEMLKFKEQMRKMEITGIEVYGNPSKQPKDYGEK